MFPVTPCAVAGCPSPAAFRSATCIMHHPDPAAYTAELVRYLEENREIADLSLPGVQLEGLDLSGKRILRCNLSHAVLSKLRFDEATFRLVFLDFAQLTDCSFRGATLHCVVFAGSTIRGGDFSGSDLLRCNFNGIDCSGTRFDESDLYASRFINATLVKTGFRDCNLRQVRFEHSRISEPDFRASNTEDAFFSEEPQHS
ncbi:MAG: pentapeptide repeat-containing protein [Spirochaetales bacterium]|nr:pentapeptide repeat-containing protein [Spirochaetales bacterium]